MKQNKVLSLSLILIGLLLVFSINNNNIQAEFTLGEIEDTEDWFESSTIVNVNQDFKTSFLFRFVNETINLEVIPFLTMQSEVNIPFNVTGYLNKKINDDNSTYGLQVSGSTGNITLSVNGTIVAHYTLSGTTYDIQIEISDGSAVSTANFDTIIGENLTIPINFSPILVSGGITGIEGVTGVSISLQPIAYVNGSISLSAVVDNQLLAWETGDEIYFEEIPISKELPNLNVTLEDINLNFEGVHLITSEIQSAIIIHTLIGDIRNDFLIDMSTVEWGDMQETLDFLIIFILDNIVQIDDQDIMIVINRASFPFYSILSVFVIFSIVVIARRKR